MKKIFYEKIGRKYVPISEYDSNLMDGLPYGNHLIMVYKNGGTRKYHVDPALAPMIAAGRFATDVISKAIVEASSMRSSKTPITEEQRNAWIALAKAFGEERHLLEWPSAMNAAIEATNVMEREAAELLKHPAIKNAYDEFMLVCKLVTDSKQP